MFLQQTIINSCSFANNLSVDLDLERELVSFLKKTFG